MKKITFAIACISIVSIVILVGVWVLLRQNQDKYFAQLALGDSKKTTVTLLGALYDDYSSATVVEHYSSDYKFPAKRFYGTEAVHVYHRWGGGHIFLFFESDQLIYKSIH